MKFCSIFKIIVIILIIPIYFFAIDFILIRTNNYPFFCPVVISQYGYFNSFEAYGLGYKVNCYIKVEPTRNPDETVSENIIKKFEIGSYSMEFNPAKFFHFPKNTPTSITIYPSN